MKKILFILLFFIYTIGLCADVKPFFFENVENDSALQQQEFEYMLQYKLYGHDYLKMGRRVKIPDKSGWNGSSGQITSFEQLVLGGPVLTDSAISLGNECQITTGPIRANTFTSDNDNGNAIFAGNICLNNPINPNSETQKGVNRGNGVFSCDSVPLAPTGLEMPIIEFPDTTQWDIRVPDRGKVFIDIPDVPSYDLYVNSIRTGTEDTLYIRYANRGTLTRIFVKDNISIGNHTVIQTFYGDSAIAQNKYRGNLLFYTNKDIRITNTDYVKLQGSFISTEEIYLRSNIDFSGQLLANRLELGDDFKGENFHFVKFDPDTIDVKLDKYGGLIEDNTTVVIPIELSDTATIAVFFSYCFDLKDGVTIEDFNIPPTFPICGVDPSKEVIIPLGSKVPTDPIKVNVKIDTLIENDYLVIKIDSITGAILPNGETSGELKIKIIDADVNKFTEFDTTKVYSFDENAINQVDTIKVINLSDSTRFVLDSAYTDRYTLDSINGVLTLIANPLDYEAKKTDTIKVSLIEGDRITTRYIEIKVVDVNEKPTISNQTFTISENVPFAQISGKIVWNDEDISNTYRNNIIKPIGGDTALFIVSEDGKITSKKGNGGFNYETDDTLYTIKVMVQDKNNQLLSDTATITIKITDLNESPRIKDSVFTITEEKTDLTAIGNVNATDEDKDSLIYTIKTTNIPFKIDDKGNIIPTRPIDYETEKIFTFVVDVSDGVNHTTSTIKVSVKNINEPLSVEDATFNVDEGKKDTIIGKVIANDKDKDSLYGTITYSVSDTANYSIDDKGNITLKTEFDFETKDKDTIKVYVTDGVFKDTATVIIVVNDVNEPLVLEDKVITISEFTTPETPIDTAKATDPDTNSVPKYTLIDTTNTFKIDSISGIITLIDSVDYERDSVYTIKVIASDGEFADTATFTIKISDENEPVHTEAKTCTIKENQIGELCTIVGYDEDSTKVIFDISDTTRYDIDTNGTISINIPFDFETEKEDSVKVYVIDTRDSTIKDSAWIKIKVEDELEKVTITSVDSLPKQDTIKTNIPNHTIDWQICELVKCEYDTLPITIHKDTVVKVCNENKTSCDSVVFLFNDVPPIVTLTNAKNTTALIDYITIEEEKDDNIYVNTKTNDLKVVVKDTINHTEKTFDIRVNLDTIPLKKDIVNEYNYVLNETNATIIPIGNDLAEMVEIIKDKETNTEVKITKIINLTTQEPIDSVQTISYVKKVDGKEITISYKTDNLTSEMVGNYIVSYNIDSCTVVSYNLNSDKKIVKNEEGNIGYTIKYEYTDDYGNKAESSVEIVFDNIPPKVEILEPYSNDIIHSNAVNVKWSVNGIVQDTLTLQRLEKGANAIIRRYVDKAGNESCDTVIVIMKEAKDIDINIVYPVTEIDKDKVDSFYSEGNKYNVDKPYTITILKDDEKPNPIGIGLKIDIALPSVSPTGGLASLNDLVKNGMIPIDDMGNIVGASTIGIPVEKYVEEHCTEEFKNDYKKNGEKIPLYDVTYYLNIWVYNNQANYVNDFSIEYTMNDEDETTDAGTITLLLDWIADKDGLVKADNNKALGTGAYLAKLYSKSVAKHRCDFKAQKKGEKTIKKSDDFTRFGYKRPKKK